MIFKELLEMLMFVESVEIIRVALFPYRSDKIILHYLFYLTSNSVKLNYKTSKHSTMVGVVRPKYPLSFFSSRKETIVTATCHHLENALIRKRMPMAMVYHVFASLAIPTMPDCHFARFFALFQLTNRCLAPTECII